MTIKIELEKELKTCNRGFDKNKIINLLKLGPTKYFIPVEDTANLLKETNDRSFEKFFKEEKTSTYLNLVLGWKLHKKVFIMPPDVLTGFLDVGDEIPYSAEEDLIFPASVLVSFPYWSNLVKIDSKIRLNILSEDLEEEPPIMLKLKLDEVLYGVRSYNGKLKLYFIMYYTQYNETEEIKQNLIHYFDIITNDNNNVMRLHYNVLECDSPMRGLLQMFLPVIYNIAMYIGTMNKHNPTPYKYTDVTIKRLGNKLVLPNPSLKEVLIGDHTTRIIEDVESGKGGKSKLRTHLRKGYWRRQWYGPRDKPEERTMDLIFIPPCIVRGFNENIN